MYCDDKTCVVEHVRCDNLSYQHEARWRSPRSQGRTYTITDVMTGWDEISVYRSCPGAVTKYRQCFGNSINWGEAVPTSRNRTTGAAEGSMFERNPPLEGRCQHPWVVQDDDYGARHNELDNWFMEHD